MRDCICSNGAPFVFVGEMMDGRGNHPRTIFLVRLGLPRPSDLSVNKHLNTTAIYYFHQPSSEPAPTRGLVVRHQPLSSRPPVDSTFLLNLPHATYPKPAPASLLECQHMTARPLSSECTINTVKFLVPLLHSMPFQNQSRFNNKQTDLGSPTQAYLNDRHVTCNSSVTSNAGKMKTFVVFSFNICTLVRDPIPADEMKYLTTRFTPHVYQPLLSPVHNLPLHTALPDLKHFRACSPPFPLSSTPASKNIPCT